MEATHHRRSMIASFASRSGRAWWDGRSSEWGRSGWGSAPPRTETRSRRAVGPRLCAAPAGQTGVRRHQTGERRRGRADRLAVLDGLRQRIGEFEFRTGRVTVPKPLDERFQAFADSVPLRHPAPDGRAVWFSDTWLSLLCRSAIELAGTEDDKVRFLWALARRTTGPTRYRCRRAGIARRPPPAVPTIARADEDR